MKTSKFLALMTAVGAAGLVFTAPSADARPPSPRGKMMVKPGPSHSHGPSIRRGPSHFHGPIRSFGVRGPVFRIGPVAFRPGFRAPVYPAYRGPVCAPRGVVRGPIIRRR